MSRWIRAFAQTTTFLGVVTIVTIWGTIYFLTSEAYERAYQDGLRQGSNLARVFEEYISSAIAGIDKELMVLRKVYQQDSAHFDFNDWIDRTGPLSSLTVHVSIAGPDGILRLSSLGPIRSTIDLKDREPFSVHINSTADELFISQPSIGILSGKASIQLTRRIFAADGSFAGIIGASLDIAELERFYDSVDIGRSGVIALVGFDGIVRARSGRDPGAGGYVGQSVGGRTMFGRFRENPAGSFWNSMNSGRFEGVKRLISYRVVDGYPLLATVGLAETDIFEEAAQTARKYDQIGLFLTVIVLCAMGFGAAHQLRLADANVAVERTNVLFDTALENMAHGLCMFDRDHRLVVCNARYGEMYGLPTELTKPGVTLRAILEWRVGVGCCPVNAPDYVAERLEEVAKSTPYYAIKEMRDGRTLAVSHEPMRGGGWVSIHQDITAQKQAETQIAYLARHDALTDLFNRAVLREKMEEGLARLRRGGRPFTLFILDLDLFKGVNDSLGHPVGDELLKIVARRLTECLSAGDTVARLGGDEFAILAEVAGDQREEADASARRLLAAVSSPYALERHRLDISTSIGIAFAPEHGIGVDQLIKNADLALYKAKLGGRNAYCLFEASMSIDAEARSALEIDLRGALARGEFDLHYHPIIDIRSNTTANLEALLRWRHPQRGPISPAEFIPLAEESGLIEPIGEWVLRRACADAARWPAPIKVAANLSPLQFRRGNLVEVIVGILKDSGLAAERLMLEITESVLMQGSRENLETLHRLRALGIAVVLDDFGTGYSSLSYLRMFPFDQIKIDRSFVSELASNSDCSAIVSAVAGLGRSLNVDTVAEGVETEEQLKLARAAGCTHAQGFLFGRPCPLAELDFTRLPGGSLKERAA
jgi:diguanylate cyclase (GGDEF)-like protein